MKYYTGLFALTQYADISEESIGLCGQLFKYLPEKDKFIADTDDTILGDYCVFDTYIVTTEEEIKCASHKRAYLDMLIKHDFNTLRSLYDEAICNLKVLHEIFIACSTFELYQDPEILNFLNEEFGSHFRSYLLSMSRDDLLTKSYDIVRSKL